MSIFLNKDSKVIVQGITGCEGTKHTALMLKAGTQVVGGVNARKAGTTVAHKDADGKTSSCRCSAASTRRSTKTGADVSIVFVPPAFAKDAVIEAIDAEIPLLVVITEGIPVQDSAYAGPTTSTKGNKTRIIGPNCPGIITPGRVAGRHHAGQHHRQGPDRPGVQVRHADLPDDVRAARSRLLDRHRHRRRPDHRHHPHRRASRPSRRTPRPRPS